MGIASRRHRVIARTLGALALAALAALAFWPGLRNFPEGDDFSLLAFARLLRDPLAPFVHEHFPLGPYFRPLSMGLWWLTAGAFGNATRPQYAVNLVLHACVALALWRLLAALARRELAAALIAAAFAVHPIAIGASLWLADRFDLLATLFALLALRSAWAATRAATPGLHVAGAIALVTCAVLAKEIGVVVVAPILALWLWPRRRGAGRAGRIGAALLAAAATAWLGWRIAVLRAAPETFGYAGVPLASLFVDGAGAWLRDFAAYAASFGRQPAAGAAALAAGGALVLAALIGPRASNVAAENGAATAPWLAGTAAMLLGCVLFEAPYAYLWSVPFAPDAVPASIAGYARLYYFPLCGIALAVGALLPRRGPAPAPVGAAGALLLVLAWGGVAHGLADAYRRQSNEKRALVMAAVQAVAGRVPPAGRCHVYLLGIGAAAPDYVLRTSTDAVIKALAPDARAIERCLIQSEQASWANTVAGARLDPDAALPLRPMYGRDGPAPWLDVGGVQVAWLNLFPDVDARAERDAVFLRRRGDRFEDVTRAVLDGELPVRFACARPPAQCRR